MNWSGAAYLQNQGADFELQRQKREAAIEEKRKNSLGYQIGHGVTGALKGAVGGGLKGALIGSILAPGVGTIAGATLGAGSGALSGGGVLSGAEQKSLASNAAQMAISKGMGSYGAAGAQSDAGGLAEAHDLFNKGKISYQDMMDYRGKIGGPAYMNY